MSSIESDLASDAKVPQGTTSVGKGSYDDDVKYIAERVKQGQCILFLGSAIHAPSPPLSPYTYLKAKCPPIGDQLSEMLAKASSYPEKDRDNLMRVSWYYERTKLFRHRLVDFVKDAVHTGREPSPVLRGLAQLKFPIVITTNYDQLYEQALDLVAKPGSPNYQKSIYSKTGDVRTTDCKPQPQPIPGYLLKIHGDVDHRDSLVITDEDYLQFVLRMTDKHPFHPVGKNVMTHLINWPTLFIGYRLSDYNLRLLFKTLRWRLDPAMVPPAYAVDLRPDVLIRDVWENERRYIRFIEKNLWTFVPDLYKAVTGKDMPK